MSKKSLSIKTVSILLVLVMLVGLAAGGTLAWLIDGTADVVNTFTYGDINITLTESDTNDGDDNPNTNEYQMIPGRTLTKDPVLTVIKGSEKAWLFVELEEIGGTDEWGFDDYLTYEVNKDIWTQLEGTENVYYAVYDPELLTEAKDVAFTVLKDNQVTVKGTVTKEMVNALDKDAANAAYPKLILTGYAVQYENMATAADAWTAVKGEYKPTAVATEAELIAAAAAGGRFELTADITITDTDGITFNKETVLYLGNHKITAAGDAIVATAGGNLVIYGEGTVAAGSGNSYCAVWANGGNVVINGGTFTSGKSHTGNGNDTIYTKNGGTVTINGGTFSAEENAASYAVPQRTCLNENDANRGTITVNGGTFIGFNPANNYSEGAGTNYVADGHTVEEDTTGAIPVYTVK